MSDENEATDSEGIKNLRKQFEEQAKALKAANDALAKYQAQERQKSVADILKAKGLPEKAATLYSGEDVSEDAVSKWASDYADVFGAQQSAGSEQSTDPNAQALARMAAATFGTSGEVSNQSTTGRVLGDPNEILHALKTLPREELQKMGYLPSDSGLFGITPPRA